MEDETPRTRNRREIREKRLAYFSSEATRPETEPKHAPVIETQQGRASKPLFRPPVRDKTSSKALDIDWSDSKSTARALNTLVSKLQNGENIVSDEIDENLHPTSEYVNQAKQSDGHQNIKSCLDDEISDKQSEISCITDTDILLSEDFTELSPTKLKSEKKKLSRKSRNNEDSQESNVMQTNQTSSYDHLESPTSTRVHDKDKVLTTQSKELHYSDDFSDVTGVHESRDSALFAVNARMTPLSRDFTAASYDSDFMKKSSTFGNNLSSGTEKLPNSLSDQVIATSLQHEEIVTTMKSSDNDAYITHPKSVYPHEPAVDMDKTPRQDNGLQDSQSVNNSYNDYIDTHTTSKPPTSKSKSFTTDNTPRKSVAESMNFSNLSMVLGEEKLRRLLQNLQASEDLDDDVIRDVTDDVDENENGGVTVYSNKVEGPASNSAARVMDNVNIWSSIDTSTLDDNVEEFVRQSRDIRGSKADGLEMTPRKSIDIDHNLSEIPPLVLSDSHQFNERVIRPNRNTHTVTMSAPSNDNPGTSQSNHDSSDNYRKTAIPPPAYSNYESQSSRLPNQSLGIDTSTDGIKHTPQLNLGDESIDFQDDLGLETHRPSSSPTKDLLYSSMKQSYDFQHPHSSQVKQSDNGSLGTADVSNITYCFSVDQIYAQATSMVYDQVPPERDTTDTYKENEPTESRQEAQVDENVTTDYTKPRSQVVEVKKAVPSTKNFHKKNIPTAKSTNFEVSRKPPPGKKSKSVEATNNRSSRKSKSFSVNPQPQNTAVKSMEKGQGDADKSMKKSTTFELNGHSIENGAIGSSGADHAVRMSQQVRASKQVPASVARYFHSLEQQVGVSMSSASVNFEPVPEPEIDVTPRSDDVIDYDVTPRKSDVFIPVDEVSPRSNDTTPRQNVTPRKKSKDNKGVKSESARRESHLKKPAKFQGTKIIEAKLRESADVLSKHFPEEERTSKSTKAGEKEKDVSPEDELYRSVQSALSEMDATEPGAIEHKLRELGIDFQFLRASRDTETTNHRQKHDAKTENTRSSVVASFQQLPVAVKSERNELSSDNMKLNNGNSHDVKKQNKRVDVIKEGAKSARVCPECAEVNANYAEECSECGGDIRNVKTVPVHSSKSPRISVIQQRRTKNQLVEEAARKDGTRNLDETLKSQLTLNLSSTDSTLTNITLPNMSTTAANTTPAPIHAIPPPPRNSSYASLGSSLSFEYSEQAENQRPTWSRDMQGQLSIDVRGSQDSSVKAESEKDRHEHVQDIRVTDDVTSQDSASVQGSRGHVGSWGQGDGPQDRGVDEESQTDRSQMNGEQEEGYLQFLQRMAQDPRLRPSRKPGAAGRGTMPQAGTSQGRPRSAGVRRAYGDVESKVRASWEKEAPSRRWEKSNLAWTSYNSRELSKPSGSGLTTKSLQIRPLSAGKSREGALSARRPQSAGKSRETGPSRSTRPMSAGKSRDNEAVAGAPGVSLRQRPKSAEQSRRSAPLHQDCGAPQADVIYDVTEPRASLPLLNVQPVKAKGNKLSKSQNSSLNYKKFLALAQGYTGKLYDIEESSEHSAHTRHQALAQALLLSPRVRSGEASFLLSLPDEILLHILSLLPQRQLARVASTCTHLQRVAADRSLWRKIVLRKSHSVSDAWLSEIGKHQPSSLSLVQCHGSNVTNAGLRELFRQCADSLEELNFPGCSRGQLTGDSILLHAASRCTNITSLDASWCNVQDQGIMALAETSNRLESLAVSGCQQLSDEAVIAVVNKHGIYLQTLELFGCFNITSRAITSIGSHCKSLTTLNLGQCWKLTDSCIAHLAPSLQQVEHLDLRGCKQITDATVHHVVRQCPRLRTLALANCAGLSDTCLAEIATYCTHIQSLDVCGCKQVSNQGLRALSSCARIQYLDLSSTAVTNKGVSMLASYCSASLEVLKVNYCRNINTQCLLRLVNNCHRLQKLYLYGVRGLGPLGELRQINPGLLVETDQARSNPLNP